MVKTPQEIVNGVDKLVSLPEVCFMVNDLVNDPNVNIKEIGSVISQDPDLTARLLKLVNSSYYGFSKPVDTVSRAILMVGLRELQHMVWASSAVETFNDIPPNDANMASFWRHSIFTAVSARILARECNVLHPERLFVSGLLHDIGRLLILQKLPEEAIQIINIQRACPARKLCEIENEILGFDHAELGKVLCESWQLPDSLSVAIGHHHTPEFNGEHELEIALLHVANVMAHALEMGEEDDFEHHVNIQAWKMLNLSQRTIKKVLQESVTQFLEVLELLLPGASQRI